MRLLVGLIAIGFIVALALVAIHHKAPEPTAVKHYELRSQACWFSVDYQRDIHCAILRVPTAQGEFELPVVVIKSDSPLRQEEPVIYLNGGPGLAMGLDAAGIARWLSWMNLMGLHRDVILMEPRGVGRALPKVQCEALSAFNRNLLTQNISIADERVQNRRVFKSCLASLAKQYPQVIPQNFGTEVSAQDVVALMKTAQVNYGYRAFHLIGVSYGTRLALEVESLASQSEFKGLISMTLDSVYPAGKGGVVNIPQIAESAFHDFFNGCVALPACVQELRGLGETSGEIQALFMRVLDHLDDQPVKLGVRVDPNEPVEYFVLNGARFMGASFSAIYSLENWPLLASAMRDALQSRDENLKTLVAQYFANQSGSDFNELVFALVDCRDNGLGDGDRYQKALADYPIFADYFRHEWSEQTCWEMGPLTPLHSHEQPEVPTLLLSGVHDPVTPVAWARELAGAWPSVIYRERKGLGHSVLTDDSCLMDKLHRFLDEPSRFVDCGE